MIFHLPEGPATIRSIIACAMRKGEYPAGHNSVFRQNHRNGRPACRRPVGMRKRMRFLGETLDVDKISADYVIGVLTLTISVHEAVTRRSIQVATSTQQAVTA